MPVIEATCVSLSPAEEDLLVRLASKIGQRFVEVGDRPSLKVITGLVGKGLVKEVTENGGRAWEITVAGRKRVTTIY